MWDIFDFNSIFNINIKYTYEMRVLNIPIAIIIIIIRYVCTCLEVETNQDICKFKIWNCSFCATFIMCHFTKAGNWCGDSIALTFLRKVWISFTRSHIFFEQQRAIFFRNTVRRASSLTTVFKMIIFLYAWHGLSVCMHIYVWERNAERNRKQIVCDFKPVYSVYWTLIVLGTTSIW